MSQDYPRPNVTADMIIPNIEGEILLIQRKNPPFQHCWALPGGFIEVGVETLEQCAVREAHEETNLLVYIATLVGVYSHPERDPRRHSVTAAYLAKPVSAEEAKDTMAGDDAGDTLWIDPQSAEFHALEIAFDHRQIIQDALRYF